jgi:translocation and assembly module TamB
MPAPEPKRRDRLPKAIFGVCLAIIVAMAAVLAVVRFGVLLPQSRTLIESRVDGLKLGRIGRLQVEGLQGDLWSDLTARRIAIVDGKGVWIEARDVHVVWSYRNLLRRRFDAELIAAREIRILRRPVLGPSSGKPGGPMPVSIRIGRLQTRVETLPAFSGRRGVYDLKAALTMERAGRRAGEVTAASLLHAGDRLDLWFDLGKGRPVRILADATEAQGGALAGALGLPADQAFKLHVDARGETSKGTFVAEAVSGARRPLWARGGWAPGGGQAAGRVDLTASRLTSDVARRLGPHLVFAGAGRKAGPEFFALDLRLKADNLGVTARGLGDLGKRRTGPKGLRIEARATDLSKIAGGPAKGPASILGSLTGDQKAWRFLGEASASRIALGGYGLERVSGPVDLSSRDKAYELVANLRGAGGAGKGYAAAILGGAPVARLKAARLADGRLLVRDLDVIGRGLRLEASGGRSLLGGLDFRGQAQLSNLAAARAGASGVLAAKWSAAQGGAGRPWTFKVDAAGERFAAGFSELDRLLGPSPRLTGEADLHEGRVTVTRAELRGAQAQFQTAGTIGPAGALALKLDWNASGPFRAGPVEITGKAKGSGAVSGDFKAPRADLLADFDAVDLPRLPLRNAHLTLTFMRQADGSSGMIAVTADSQYGPANAKSDFRFPQGGVDLTELSVDAAGVKASGSFALRRRTPSAADLQVAVGPGAFLAGGSVTGSVKIVDSAAGARASLNLTAERAVLPGGAVSIRDGRIAASGPLARLPYQANLKGAHRSGPWTLAGNGMLSTQDQGYQLTFDGSGQAGGRALRTTEPAVFGFGGPAQSARLRLASSDGGRIDLDGRLAEGAADVRATVAKLGLRTLDQDLDGEVDGTIVLQGRGGALSGTMQAQLQDARARGSAPAAGLDGTLKAQLTDESLSIEGQAATGEGLRANADLVLPAETSASPFRIAINRTRAMRGTFFAEGEIKPLWDLLVGGERSLAGHVRTEGTLSGTLADPRAVGTAQMDGGKFDDGATGLTLRDVVLRADLSNAAIDVTKLSAADGRGGGLDGAGRISLLRNGASSFRLDLKGFRLIDNDLATATASGRTTIDRAADGKVRLSGALTIDRADVAAEPPTPTGVVNIDVVERNRPDALNPPLPPPAAAAAGVGGWALDVSLKAPRRVYLRGRGLDLEMSLDAHVGGTTARPRLSGVARVVRGDYDFAGKRFVFDNRGVVYLSTRPEEIRLDLTATRDDPALTAVVQIKGTAADPDISLTSSPVLPNDEVLSQVLFGRSASQLSSFEAAQLASALSALSGNGGFDLVGNLRSFARLDRLSLGGDEASGVTVSGGKYLTDDVYLELTGGGREGPSAQVEWRIGRSLSLLSRLAGQQDAKIAIRWRRDY